MLSYPGILASAPDIAPAVSVKIKPRHASDVCNHVVVDVGHRLAHGFAEVADPYDNATLALGLNHDTRVAVHPLLSLEEQSSAARLVERVAPTGSILRQEIVSSNIQSV